MGRFLLRALGHKAARHAMRQHAGPGGLFDLRGGFAMLRDRNVAMYPKLLAMGVGIAFTALLLAFEAPLEFLIALFLPFFGLEFDLLVDGVEMFVLPVLIASLLLPRLLRTPVPVRVLAPRR